MALLQPVTPRELHGRRKLEVFAPATLERLGEIEVASPEDVSAAVGRARVAQVEWAARSFDERERLLLRARALLVERADEIADVICSDTGKPRLEAMTAEILGGCDALTFYAKNARRLLRDEKKRLHLMKTKKLVLSYRPMGVIGIITPWNFPFMLSLNPTAQALAAGNAVVLKPSEITPFVGLALAKLFADSGLPENVFQVVTGDGSTGAALVDAGCDKISFTGSARTGRRIAEACGRALVPCTLELGGKDPMIVCDDADIERAARGAVWGAFTNSGQVCMSTERVYVVEKVASAFTGRVVELTRELRQGPETEGDVDLGAITSPAQLEIIEQHVADAVAKGAKILTGGRRNPAWPGLFFEPTVLVDVNHEMAIMREETFGPCLPIQVVSDEEEALRLANDSCYGLQASVWTRDTWKGKRLANRIAAGGVVVDDCMVTYGISESPFGGVKESGIGRVNGELGLKSFCHVQSVVLPRMRGKSEPLWYPYSTRTLRLARRALGLLYRSPLGKLLGS
ncbi:MAG: aldehyde dehydrogenase family protein [Deltaproteobacteria bacterium]|nr:aldehyde dehydrogenase family protein [Deltaproteobacteria bacterium]